MSGWQPKEHAGRAGSGRVPAHSVLPGEGTAGRGNSAAGRNDVKAEGVPMRLTEAGVDAAGEAVAHWVNLGPVGRR